MVVSTRRGGSPESNCLRRRSRWPAISSTAWPAAGWSSQAGKSAGRRPEKLNRSPAQRIDVARMGDDDEQGARRVQGQGGGGQAGGGTPGAVHDAAASLAQGGEQRVETFGGL